MKTTIGAILINDAFPEKLRNYSDVFGKKVVKRRLTDLAQQFPKQYASTVLKIKKLGDKLSYDLGASFSLDDLSPVAYKNEAIVEAKKIFAESNKIKDKDIRNDFLADKIGALRGKIISFIEDKTVDTNRLTKQVASGARGNANQLNSMIGAPLLYADHKDRVIPKLIVNNFSEGLTPMEYWASSYGTRKGTVSTALGTGIAGQFSKEINRGVDTLVVTENDCGTTNGIMENINDYSMIGRFLAKGVAGLKRNTLVTPEIIDLLRKAKETKVQVRSPITCEAKKGVCTYCRGVTEYNRKPVVGENIGLVSAQTVTEPITQSALSTKHTGGLAGKKTLVASVLDLSKQIMHIPTNFVNEIPLAPEDGTISSIHKAPQGGSYVTINDSMQYIRPNLNIKVKVGDKVEAGDTLTNESEGLVNPAMLIRYKGLGEGRKYFVDKFTSWLSDKGIDKKHFETLSRAILNKVVITKDKAFDDFVPDDIIDYTYAIENWVPTSKKQEKIENTIGKYLTENVAHHLAGTQIKPSFLRDFKEWGIKSVEVTEEEPPFEPFAIRLNDIPKTSLDWAKRLGATHLKDSILDATRRGMLSNEKGTSFYLPLASGKTFGVSREGGKY